MADQDPDKLLALMQEASLKTGLSIMTVQDLIMNGWVLEQEIQGPYRFVKRGIS